MSGWGDGFDDSTMPWYLFYDWVEVHTYDTETKEFSLAWREDFTGEDGAHINTDRFNVRDNYGPSSNRRTKAMASNVYIYEDVMTLQMSKTDEQILPTFPVGNAFYSGTIKTKEAYKYGKWKTSMKVSDHKGTFASFHLNYEGPNQGTTNTNEIDFFVVPSMADSYADSPLSTEI